jgi:hypothetical protein
VRLLVLALAIILAACTPAQVALWSDTGAGVIHHARERGLSDGELAALRWCESRGDYTAVSPSGVYRGAFQFDQATFDATALRQGWWWLVGRDPATVNPYWQDAIVAALWLWRGGQPWPVCGRWLP